MQTTADLDRLVLATLEANFSRELDVLDIRQQAGMDISAARVRGSLKRLQALGQADWRGYRTLLWKATTEAASASRKESKDRMATLHQERTALRSAVIAELATVGIQASAGPGGVTLGPKGQAILLECLLESRK
jgi:hypothetical protein